MTTLMRQALYGKTFKASIFLRAQKKAEVLMVEDCLSSMDAHTRAEAHAKRKKMDVSVIVVSPC